jgi:hypothetical protein
MMGGQKIEEHYLETISARSDHCIEQESKVGGSLSLSMCRRMSGWVMEKGERECDLINCAGSVLRRLTSSLR